jgi:hypothetical protein
MIHTQPKPAAMGGGRRANCPDRTFCQLLSTTYSRSPSAASRPPSWTGPDESPGRMCWGAAVIRALPRWPLG